MSKLPGYVITNQIYAGSEYHLSHGYRAADGYPVVVKASASEYPTLRESAKLRHEYAVLQKLDTPGVPRALEFISHGHGHALILADVGGKPLNELLEPYLSNIELALGIAISLADTISYIHAQHVIHKDIKPHNVAVEEGTAETFRVGAKPGQRAGRAAERVGATTS